MAQEDGVQDLRAAGNIVRREWAAAWPVFRLLLPFPPLALAARQTGSDGALFPIAALLAVTMPMAFVPSVITRELERRAFSFSEAPREISRYEWICVCGAYLSIVSASLVVLLGSAWPARGLDSEALRFVTVLLELTLFGAALMPFLVATFRRKAPAIGVGMPVVMIASLFPGFFGGSRPDLEWWGIEAVTARRWALLIFVIGLPVASAWPRTTNRRTGGRVLLAGGLFAVVLALALTGGALDLRLAQLRLAPNLRIVGVQATDDGSRMAIALSSPDPRARWPGWGHPRRLLLVDREQMIQRFSPAIRTFGRVGASGLWFDEWGFGFERLGSWASTFVERRRWESADRLANWQVATTAGLGAEPIWWTRGPAFDDGSFVAPIEDPHGYVELGHFRLDGSIRRIEPDIYRPEFAALAISSSGEIVSLWSERESDSELAAAMAIVRLSPDGGVGTQCLPVASAYRPQLSPNGRFAAITARAGIEVWALAPEPTKIYSLHRGGDSPRLWPLDDGTLIWVHSVHLTGDRGQSILAATRGSQERSEILFDGYVRSVTGPSAELLYVTTHREDYGGTWSDCSLHRVHGDGSVEPNLVRNVECSAIGPRPRFPLLADGSILVWNDRFVFRVPPSGQPERWYSFDPERASRLEP